jgi:hypothetical protein
MRVALTYPANFFLLPSNNRFSLLIVLRFLQPQTNNSSTLLTMTAEHTTMTAEHSNQEAQLAKINAVWLLHADNPKLKSRYSDAANSNEQPTRQLEFKSNWPGFRKSDVELIDGRWCSKINDVFLPIITIQTLCQQVHCGWMKFRDSSFNVKRFVDEFRNAWAGARREDVRFIVNAIENTILGTKRAESEVLDDVESCKLSKSTPKGHLLRGYSKTPNNPAAD